jgi:hypothetical protein
MSKLILSINVSLLNLGSTVLRTAGETYGLLENLEV